MSSYFNTYINSPSLLLFQQKVEISGDMNEEENKKPKELPQIDSNPSEKETLNIMFPPKEFEENGKKYIQYVSIDKATRDQARDLFKALDDKIRERQAREKGICPVREELYNQCFDEIIRQVTIECPERGLLLLRVRDEIKMNKLIALSNRIEGRDIIIKGIQYASFFCKYVRIKLKIQVKVL